MSGILEQLNPASIITDVAKGLISRLWPDPAQQAEAQRRLIELQQSGQLAELEASVKVQLAQIDVNKLDAQGNWWQRGWRPAIGWTCALSIFFYYVPYVIAATMLWVMQVLNTGTLVSRPDLGVADLMGLTFSLLGMSAMRTIERLNGNK